MGKHTLGDQTIECEFYRYFEDTNITFVAGFNVFSSKTVAKAVSNAVSQNLTLFYMTKQNCATMYLTFGLFSI